MRLCILSDDKCLMNMERTGAWEERLRPVSGSVPLPARSEEGHGDLRRTAGHLAET